MIDQQISAIFLSRRVAHLTEFLIFCFGYSCSVGHLEQVTMYGGFFEKS
jgi:hypothetical protein